MDMQIMPVADALMQEADLQDIYLETGQGPAYLQLPKAYLHWMFRQQIEDKSGQLHQTDPMLWVSIAVGPLLDCFEHHMNTISCEVVGISADSEEQESLPTSITGFIDIYEQDDDWLSHPFKLQVTHSTWMRLYEKIDSLAIDATQDSMPVKCHLTGGAIRLAPDTINDLQEGDFIPITGTPINQGCAVLTSTLAPRIFVNVEGDALTLSDEIPNTPQNTRDATQVSLQIYLARLNSTIGELRGFTQTPSMPITFDVAVGENLKLMHKKRIIATGALWQLGERLGIRIQEIPDE